MLLNILNTALDIVGAVVIVFVIVYLIRTFRSEIKFAKDYEDKYGSPYD